MSGALAKVYVSTLHIFYLYFQLAAGAVDRTGAGSQFLATLGKHTAIQYLPPDRGLPLEGARQVDEIAVFYAKVDDINIVTPLRVRALLLALFPLPGGFFVVQLYCITRELGGVADIFEIAKNEWFQDRYGGIAVFTRDGISCHMNSASLHVPLYGIATLVSPNDILKRLETDIRFFDYSEEVALFDACRMQRIFDITVKNALSNIGWII